jgi:hypothetical protein
MIHHDLTKPTSGALFGFGTVGIFTGKNDKMDNHPYILLQETVEPQEISTEVSLKETPLKDRKIFLQFSNRKSFDVFKAAIDYFEENCLKDIP